LNFCETATVSFFAREPRRDKRADDLECEFDSDHARAQAQHVAIVVFS